MKLWFFCRVTIYIYICLCYIYWGFSFPHNTINEFIIQGRCDCKIRRIFWNHNDVFIEKFWLRASTSRFSSHIRLILKSKGSRHAFSMSHSSNGEGQPRPKRSRRSFGLLTHIILLLETQIDHNMPHLSNGEGWP